MQRHGAARSDHDGRIPHRDGQVQTILLPADVLLRNLEHAARDHLHPYRTADRAGLQPQSDAIETESIRRTGVRVPKEPHLAAEARETGRGQLALGRVARIETTFEPEPCVALRDRNGVRLVSEEAEHVAERMVRRTHIHGVTVIVAPDKPKALQHEAVVVVHQGEEPRRHRVRGIGDSAAQQPFGLRVFRPFDVRQRMGIFELRGAPRLTLHRVERAAVAFDEFPQRFGARPPRCIGIGVVRVENEARTEVERVLLLELFENACVALRKVDRRAVDLRVRLDGADRPRRAAEKLRVVRPLPERLVPHLPFVHNILVAADARLHVSDPRRERLWIARHLAHLHAETEVAPVDRVAVGEADPRLHAEGRHFAHGPVEPREVVDALLLLRLRPAGEEPPVLRAELADILLHRLPLGVVTVERFAADGPRRRLQVLRVAHGKAPDLLQARIEFVQPLPRHALSRRRVECLQPLLRPLHGH